MRFWKVHATIAIEGSVEEMVLQYYVVETATGKQIEIDIESATNEDLTSTKEKWQSDWTSELSAIQSWKSMRRKQMLAKL